MSDYTIKSRGTNSQGNKWDRRDYGSDVVNPNSYHYSNADGSWYYSNPDGSTYWNDGKDRARYTPPPSPAEKGNASSGSSTASESRMRRDLKGTPSTVIEVARDSRIEGDSR